MTYQGAKGSTLKALEETLQVPNTEVMATGYDRFMTQLNDVSEVTLLMANKIYVKDGLNVKEEYKNTVETKFRSEVQSLDFSKSDEAVKVINGWVMKKTYGKIQDIVNKESINVDTGLVLVNALYFKGNWKTQFMKQRTEKKPFYINSKDTINVEMMNIEATFMYKSDPIIGAKVLKMPYKNSNLSMLFILPNKIDGLENLESKLESYPLANITYMMRNVNVKVSLPKFKIEGTIPLVEILRKMGLEIIFDGNKANFSNIADIIDDNLFVTEAIQKIFIEVNEEGAKAAAATAVVMGLFGCARPMMPPEITIFNADHPFVFYLIYEDQQNSHILFSGHLTKPQCG